MTLDVALTIASKRDVELWPMCVAGSAGWSPDSLRETALDILTTEVERLQAELAVCDTSGSRSWSWKRAAADTKRALATAEVHAKGHSLNVLSLMKFNDQLKEEIAALREQVAEREEAAFMAGWIEGNSEGVHGLTWTWIEGNSEVVHGLTWTYSQESQQRDAAFLRWQARQKGTPT